MLMGCCVILRGSQRMGQTSLSLILSARSEAMVYPEGWVEVTKVLLF